MIIDRSVPETLEELIRGCEKNLERLKTCQFTHKEKTELRQIYTQQLQKYNQERLSFLKVPN